MTNKITNYITFKGDTRIIQRIINQISENELYRDTNGEDTITYQVATLISDRIRFVQIFEEYDDIICILFLTNWSGIPLEVAEFALNNPTIQVDYLWIDSYQGISCINSYLDGKLIGEEVKEFGFELREDDSLNCETCEVDIFEIEN